MIRFLLAVSLLLFQFHFTKAQWKKREAFYDYYYQVSAGNKKGNGEFIIIH